MNLPNKKDVFLGGLERCCQSKKLLNSPLSFEFVRFFYRAHSNDARGVTKAEVLPVIVLVRLNLCCVGNNKHPRISHGPHFIRT